ncbi:MAG: NPCBM/NEW2 domain-containing protein [Planctomycetes bacterium]|nr:NPCBM/NEW2 domain-containing protein [Planctomycetota bacterium]
MTRQIAAAMMLSVWAGFCLAETVETVDLQKLKGTVVSISTQQVLMTVDGKDRTFQPSEISEISFIKADDVMSARNKDQPEGAEQNVIVTASGDRLLASDLTIADGKIRFTNPLLGQRELGLSDASIIYHPIENLAAVDIEQRCREMKCQPGQLDMLVVIRTAEKESEWLTFDGVIKGLAQEKDAEKTVKKILFNLEETDKKVSYDSIAAIYLPSTAKPAKTSGLLTGRCGSTVGFTSLTMEGEKLTVESPQLGKLQIARDAVASIKMTSLKMVLLSDLKPSKAVEQGFFDTTFHYRVNASAGGGKLRMGGQEYSSGLGLHSSCELTFDLDGQYSLMVADVGIDDAVKPNGDAELTILGDGKELLKPRKLAGKDNLSTIRLDLKGVKKLVIKVGFGADGLDIGDHVDIAGARLVK